MNVVMTGAGRFVEVQGTAEGAPFSPQRARPAARSGRGRHPRHLRPATRGAGRAAGAPVLLTLFSARPSERPRPDSSSRPRTPTRRRRSPASSPTPAHPSCSIPRPADVPEVDETGATLEANARLKAVGLGGRHRAPRDRRRHRPRSRRARRRARRLLGPLRRPRRHLRRQLHHLLRRLTASRPSAARLVSPPWPWRAGPTAGKSPRSALVEGTIAESPAGVEGFGYDPVFVPTEGDGRSFAEMTSRREARDLASRPRVPYAR